MKDPNDVKTGDMLLSNIVEFDPSKHFVTKSNSLIESARIAFTVMEQRVLHIALSQIAKGDAVTDQQFYEIPMAIMADLTGREVSGELYKATRAAARSLKRKDIKLKLTPKGKKLPKILEISMVQSLTYDEEGKVFIRFNADAIPYLSGFEGIGFTQYSIKGDLLQMDSAHAYRLHDLIARWGDIGMKEIQIEDARWMFGVDDKYPRFNNFRARVIEPAIADVNKHSVYQVKARYRRVKKRVVAIQFQFGLKKPEKAKLTQKYIEKHARPGESWENAKTRLKSVTL